LLAANTYYQRVVTATGGCSNISTSNSILITINQLPTGAIAGADQTICATGATLSANTPAVGTGVWTVYAGSGNVTSPTSYTSNVNGLNTGLNVFVWTISNGVCPSSSDTLKINVYAQPAPANAGSDQFLCSVTNTTLTANIPIEGTGIWTVLSGTSTVTSPVTNTTSVTGLSLGQNAFVWTISNGSCPSSKDTVYVQVDANPSPAVVAINQSICVSTVTLSATGPSVGTGTWSLLSGSGTIASPATNTTSVTGLSVGQNNFLWTVSNGVCTPTSNTLTIQVDAVPSVASGIVNQNICASATLLNANNPTVGSGTWSVISGGGTISSLHTNTTSVTGLSIGQNLFVWSITNGVCPASTDTFKVKVDAVPSPATAGGDQSICSSSSVLNAAIPAIGNGTWHVLTGSSTLLSPTTNSTSVMGLTVGTNSFEWVVSNGVCPVNIDTVIVIVSAPPSAANAGSDKSICVSSYTLNAVPPASGNGNWNVLFGGTASVTIPALNNSPVTGLSIGSNSFEWVVSNGACPVTRDTVVITVNLLPNLSVNGNTVICNGSSTTLIVSGADTYSWTGGPNTNIYSVSPVISTTYTVSGTDTVTTCSNTVTQTVIVKPTLFSSQTVTVCSGGSVTVGTVVHSTSGTYTDVLTGSNGCDSTITTNLTVRPKIIYTQSPVVCYGQSYYVGTHTYTASGTYTDVLTSSATGCDSTIITNLTVRQAIASIQSPVICYGQSYSLGANTYTASGTYINILTAQNGCDSTITINLTVRPAIASTQNFTICTGESVHVGSSSYSSAGTYTNVLTSSSGCDSVVITYLRVDALPTIANAGHDSTIYNSSMLLSGNIPAVGSGMWSIVSGSVIFADNTNANTEVSNLGPGQAVLQWTISNGVCPVSYDEITITVKSLLIPNGFSPNGDGVNDAFEIPGLDEFSNVKLNVFNRWGSTVYDSKDYRNNWTGKNMSGEDLSDDTYFFTLEIPDKKRYEGYVILKRK
jgi:gliding motility-associated-like protein